MNWGSNGNRWGAGELPEGPSYPPAHEPVEPPEPRSRLWVHVLLLLATFATTTLVSGFLYSVALLAILGIHEFGHYFAARRWGVKATLPYFIPFPFSFGTMGAVIKIRSPIPNRNALIDIGAAGPIAGFVAAIFALCIGLSLSEIKPVPEAGGGIFLGDSILLSLLIDLTIGKPAPGTDVFLHPIALAGWLGLFITVLNLLPLGQLDGGHIVYALFGRRHVLIANASTVVLCLLTVAGPPYGWLHTPEAFGLMGAFKVWVASRWYGWLFFIFLIRSFLGVRHPPPVDAETPVDTSRRMIGYISGAIFVLCFIPVPMGEL